ncbi:hypothetical protein AAFF_G00079050 [Aldrovandia affinis]|uniref:Uncharacterized protein n=1 Tax=Aldrovandia affinis TaxID=143900 RepID=A0AAD7WDM5_9TELE|nr:hypothetical protein AAFF_G00079050 [Aldrovandia affinis]
MATRFAMLRSEKGPMLIHYGAALVLNYRGHGVSLDELTVGCSVQCGGHGATITAAGAANSPVRRVACSHTSRCHQLLQSPGSGSPTTAR